MQDAVGSGTHNCQATVILIIRFDICHLHRLEERQSVAVLPFFPPSSHHLFYKGFGICGSCGDSATSFISESTSQVEAESAG